MGWFAALALLACLLLPGCVHAAPGETALPEWLTRLIRGLESEPVANPPAAIYRYEYRGQVVYYLPPRCCDVPSDLYDQEGNIICHPDGGLMGVGDGRCTDFFDRRQKEALVWRDKRAGR